MDLKDKLLLGISAATFASSAYLFQQKDYALDEINRGPAIGRLETISNTVKQKPKGTLAWLDADSGQNLYFNDQIFTHNESYAKLKLGEEITLNLSPNTLIKLGKDLDSLDLNLSQGFFSVDVTKGKKFNVSLGGKKIAIDSQNAKLQIQSTGHTNQLYLKDGKAQVSSGNKLHQIDAGTTVIPKGAIVSVKIEAIMSSFPYLKEKEVEQLFKLDPTIDVDRLKTLLATGNKLADIMTVYHVRPKADFSTLVRISKFEKIKNLSKLLKNQPNLTLKQVEDLLKSDAKISLDDLNNSLASNPSLDIGSVLALSQKHKSATPKEILKTLELRPGTDIPDIEKTLASNSKLNLAQVNSMLGYNSKLQLVHIRELTNSYPQITTDQLTSLSKSQQIANIPSLSENFSAEMLSGIIQANPNVDLLSLKEYSKINKKINPSLLPQTFAANPNIPIKELSSILNSNEGMEHSHFNQIIKSNPSLSLSQLGSLISTIPSSQIGGLVSYLSEFPSSDLNSLDGSLKTNPSINLNNKSDRKKLFAIAASNSKNNTFDKKRLAAFKEKNPNFKESSLLSIMAVSPSLTPDDLRSYVSDFPKTSTASLVSLLSAAPKSNLKALSKLRDDHSQLTPNALAKIFRENPYITPEDLDRIFENRDDITPELLAANSSGVKDFSSYSQIIANNKSVALPTLYAFTQRYPNASLSVINRMLKNDSSASLAGFETLLAANSKIKLAQIEQLQKKYPKLKTSHLQSIFSRAPQTSPSSLSQLMKAASNTDGAHLETLYLLGKDLKANQLAQFLTSQKKYGVKDLIPLYSVAPKTSPLDIDTALRNDKKLTLENLVTAIQANPGMHVKFITSATLDQSQKSDDLIIVKQNVQPKDAPSVYRIDQKDKIKLSWDSNQKAQKSKVLISTDPQFSNVVQEIPVNQLKAYRPSHTAEKVDEILPLLKNVSADIKEKDIPAIVAMNPDISAQDFIFLLKKQDDLKAKELKSLLSVKPNINLKELAIALDRVKLETIRSILATNSQIDVKDIGDIRYMRRDIKEEELVKSVSPAINFKDFKDLIINFPSIQPHEINQIANTNPNLDLKVLYSLNKLQTSISTHKLNNTTRQYPQAKSSTIKSLAQKRPEIVIQSINSILAAGSQKRLEQAQDVISNDPTCSVSEMSALIKTNPNIKLAEIKDLLVKHPHLQGSEIIKILTQHPKLVVRKLEKTFAVNSALTPEILHQILAQKPDLTLEQVTNLLQSTPTIDTSRVPALLAAGAKINSKEIINFFEKNPKVTINEIIPLLTIKPNLDLDDVSSGLKSGAKIEDLERGLITSGSVRPLKAEKEETVKKINSIISAYPQINRSEVESVIKNNPNLNIQDYKEILDSNISISDLHQILITSPKTQLKDIDRLNDNYNLHQVSELLKIHPQVTATQLLSLPKDTPLQTMNRTLASRPQMSLRDYSKFIRNNDDLEPNVTLEVLADSPKISLLRLLELYRRAPDTDIKLIGKAFNHNTKFSLEEFTTYLKRFPKRDSNQTLILLSNNPEIPLDHLTEFSKKNPNVSNGQLAKIYTQRQYIELRQLNQTLSLSPKLRAEEVATLLEENVHINLSQLNKLLRNHKQLSKKQVKSLSKAINFKDVPEALSTIPTKSVVACIDANPNVDLKKLQILYKTHPNISDRDIQKTLTLSPEIDLAIVSTFLSQNTRYQLFDVNDLLEINPKVDLLALSKVHQTHPQVQKGDMLKLLAAAPLIDYKLLNNTPGDFKTLLSLIQTHPETNLGSLNKLIALKPQTNLNNLKQTLKKNPGVTIDDLVIEVQKDSTLSLDNPRLVQSLMSRKQNLKVGGLNQGSYYWKVSSKLDDINVESPVTAFRVELGTIPIPLYPKNNVEILTTNFERSVRLRWEKQEAKKYELELTYWDESNKVTTTQNFVTENNFIDLKDLATRKYSWKVRVSDTNRPNAMWSNSNSFVIKNRPFFIPQYPLQGEKVIVNNNFPAIKFKWKGIEDTPYVVTLASDKNFYDVITKKTVKGTSFTWENPVPGRLFWKLSLTSNDLQSPHVQPIEVYCSPIKIVSPLKNEKLVLYKREQDMTFKWKNTTPNSFQKGKTTYIVELSEDAGFNKTITNKEITANSITLTFSQPKKYFWRIRLKDPSKYDTPSTSTPFEVKLSPPPAPPVIKKSIIQEIKEGPLSSRISRPKISRSIASEDDDENSDYKNTYVDIEWYEVNYIEGYIIEVYEDQELTKLVHRAKTQDNHYRWKAAVPGNFYYRLASYDFWARQSPFTPAETMTITVPRKAPKLDEPAVDGVRIINRSGGMKFSWSRVKYTANYQWELAKDKDFSKVLLTRTNQGSHENEIDLPKNMITDIGYHFWRVRSNFPIGDPMISEIRRVSLENVMEFDHDLWVTGIGYTQSISETTEQDDTYFASEGTVNKGMQFGGSVEYVLTGKKLEYGRYKKKFQLSSELTVRSVLNHEYDLPMLEYSLKEKFVSNNFSLWGYNPAFIGAFEKSAHLSSRSGTLGVQPTLTFLLGLGITKQYFLWERRLDATFEILTPIYFSTSEDLYAIPISSLKIFLRGRYNIWGPFDMGLDFSYSFYNNVIDSPFTYTDLYVAGTLTIKMF